MIKTERLVLASSSSRRVELLRQIGITPSAIVAPMVNESPNKKELPKDYSTRIAREKGYKVFCSYSNDFVLSADTVVCCGRRILPKAKTQEQAIQCLKLISGCRHRVYTTVCLHTPGGKVHVKNVVTTIKMKRLSQQELDYYILSNQWKNRAGAFNIQGIAGMFIIWMKGSYSSVVGLPLYETYCILSQYFDLCLFLENNV